MWHRILLGIVIIINLLLAGRLFLSDQGLRGYSFLKSQKHDLEKNLAQTNEKNMRLSLEIELLNNDDKYLEKIIRDKLNFVKDNEVLYLFQDSQPPSTSGATSDDGKN